MCRESMYGIMRKEKKEGGCLYKNWGERLKDGGRGVGGKGIVIGNGVSMRERGKEVDGVGFGDFEMDRMVGKGNCGGIVRLVEKERNMVFMRKLKEGKNGKKLGESVKKIVMGLKGKIKWIRRENGMEFGGDEIMRKCVGVGV